jgi:hypothetical protein
MRLSDARMPRESRRSQVLWAALVKIVAIAAIMLVTLPATVQAGYLDPNQGEVWYKCFRNDRRVVGKQLMEVWDETCRPSADGSFYAIPVLYRNGVAVTPNQIHVYLRNLTTVKPSVLPSGLGLKIGNPKATSPQPEWSTRYYWQCNATVASTHYVKPPNCHGAADGSPYTALTLIIRAPQCVHGTIWTYPKSGACPAGSTTTVQVQYHIQYAIADAGSSDMRWSSGSIYGVFAKFRNHWYVPTEQHYIDICMVPALSCAILEGDVIGTA